MKHLGDITKLNGAEIPIVDCITGGSPCQDLSVAGKRAGLAGERSGLFMEQIRVIKEMRENDRRNGRTGESVRPRFMVWENVPGAFSSNGGLDFKAVLEETVRIACPVAPDLPMPEGWTMAGCLSGDGWSVAWRVHDAQFWGVPQRRRRISLVADFGGQSAPEILFERKGLPRDSQQGKTQRERTSESAGECAENSGNESIEPLPFDTTQITSKTNRSNPNYGDPCHTLHAYGHAPSIVFDARGNGDGTVCPTITGGHQDRVTDYTEIAIATQACGTRKNPSQSFSEEKAFTIPSNPMSDRGQAVISVDWRCSWDGTQTANTKVRRLTPLECERLQNFPDGWTNIGEWTDSRGKKHQTADSARYKALGNSIALPFWDWLLGRITAQYDRPATLGSLFDGIGGFPLCWERHNGKGSTLWASEIEEFPIAVTKRRFPE